MPISWDVTAPPGSVPAAEPRVEFRQSEGVSRKFANLTDESLLAYCESVRRQVSADARLG
jgi:hypothetical protein